MAKKKADIAAVLQAIADCAKKGSDTLDLSGMDLTELPPEVAALTSLATLDLSRNRLKTLPPTMGALTALQSLGLAENGLTELPPEIATMTALATLDLSGNRLTTLPPSIGALTALEELDLSGNQLASLPVEIGALTALRSLGLFKNRFTELPTEIATLPSLRSLDLSGNQLTTLPPSLGALTSLESLRLEDIKLVSLPAEIGALTALKYLHLGHNRLTALPPEIGKLTSLILLTVNHNELTALPPEIGGLAALQGLYCYRTELTTLPPEIAGLSSLDTLNLWGCKLNALPPEIGKLTALISIDLDQNQLTALPPEIAKLTALRNLSLASNQLTALPLELAGLPELANIICESNPLPASYFDALRQGVDSLLALLESLREKTEPLFEGKLLVTGEGQVGKSWTLAKLQGRDPLEEVGTDNTTWGIDRGELRLPHPGQKAEILLNTWDFGGQKIYRVTHQFFFSEQAIYILVWNPRQGSEQCRVREWLRMIALRTAPISAGGEAYQPRAKVIMVATHAQSEGGSYNPDYGRANLERDLQEMIVDEVQIDSKTDYGIKELRDKIALHAAALPEMGQPLNARWAAAREAVLALRDKKPWIDFEEFTTICRAHGVTDREQLRTLAWTYLHSLGRAIWYGTKEDSEFDDPLLADTIVLDAVWLSRAFVQVLDDEQTQAAGGMLDHRRFPAIWTNHHRIGWHRYKPNEYEILKLVMRRFDVALPTRESQGRFSLVPQLVPYEQPPLPWTDAAQAPGPRTIRLSCQLGYEAIGLMARLIAATEPWHVYAEGVGLFWERGVFLKDEASFNNQALLIVSGTEKPRIDVIVSGDQPAFLMHELYKILESVLAFWMGMKKEYYIKCPTKYPDGTHCPGQFKYDAIVRRIEDKNETAFDCQDCDASWKAERLIHGFEALMISDSYILNHLYNRDQLPCPKMFLLEPADRRLLSVTSWAGFIGERFKLTLLSELSGQKVASEEFTLVREWVKWVKPLTSIASLALAGTALPISGELAAEIKEGATILDKIGALPEDIGDMKAIQGRQDLKNIRLTHDQLVNFARFLRAINLAPRDRGMDIAQAPDGRWLWMSSDEVQIHTPQQAAKP